MPEDIQGHKGLTKPEGPTGDVHYGPFGEKHPTASAVEQARKDSLKIGKTYPGPLGESYNSAEDALNAQQLHDSQMIDDKHAQQAAKDSLNLGDSVRASEQQRLSGNLINTPKSTPNK